MTCEHPDFLADVEVNRLKRSDDDPTVIGFTADVRIWCALCQEAMVFVGAPLGLAASHPTASIDRSTLHAPLRPQFGEAGEWPGFSVDVWTS